MKRPPNNKIKIRSKVRAPRTKVMKDARKDKERKACRGKIRISEFVKNVKNM